MSDKNTFDRRLFLKLGLACAATLAFPVSGWAQFKNARSREKTLSFYNTHTGEELKNVVFWADGRYLPETMRDINYLLRDFRNNETADIDPLLCDQLFSVRQKLGTDRPFHIISGYRSPETNSMLRSRSSGVAKKSLHLVGRAVDVRVPGSHLVDLRKAALALEAGGVGYYPTSNFVHLDTGPVRRW
ncbi:MAG: DUF882 domain-containing protein [Syntrophotaleaceae bacterium]